MKQVGGVSPGKFIARFGGQHRGPQAARYGMQPHPAGAVRPGMDYDTAPTMNHYGLNSSGRPSDASAPTPNTGPQNMGS